MNEFLATNLAAWISILMVALGSGAAVWILLGNPDSALREAWDKYVELINKEIRFLLIRKDPTRIAQQQVAALVVTLIIYQLTGNFFVLFLTILVAILPLAMLRSQRDKRITKLEEQLDGWLLMLANALKATPAIGEAIKSTVTLVQAPIAEELDLLVKENQLGTPLDEAILNASERIGSPMVSGSLAMLVVARATGGDLPTILETSAGSLREMARLEGVVRTKTAEGKGQVWVLGAMPWVLALALSQMDPDWWPTISDTVTGNIILAVGMSMWIVAIFWGRSILSVDI
ncbi:MAG: type II secretion system F family protein [Polyangiales bacterium]